jgi:hypothetical protein
VPSWCGFSIPPPPPWKSPEHPAFLPCGMLSGTIVGSLRWGLLLQESSQTNGLFSGQRQLGDRESSGDSGERSSVPNSTHLRYPTRVFSRGERQRDERFTNRVLTSLRNSCFPKRGSLQPFMKPLLRQRRSLTVSEGEIVRAEHVLFIVRRAVSELKISAQVIDQLH